MTTKNKDHPKCLSTTPHFTEEAPPSYDETIETMKPSEVSKLPRHTHSSPICSNQESKTVANINSITIALRSFDYDDGRNDMLKEIASSELKNLSIKDVISILKTFDWDKNKIKAMETLNPHMNPLITRSQKITSIPLVMEWDEGKKGILKFL
ncbi:MAG: hypothetical protein Sylvanvirus10_27 [Sylvanvirus sp.]|uniref:DUF4476 domain-containing protein n=1 Tax=Sylvanvirus sp. TaxID=2487774 RepID=A0A3G5AI28_9VIRU|nr:MAG: hypothetical protein Sylvanvirus10_27 [Sylvanvirus sp.]